MCESASPSSLDRNSRSRALSPDMVVPSPTADLNKVSNLAWSDAVMKDNRILGILLACFLAGAPVGWLWAPPVLKEAAMALKPVGWATTGLGGGGGMPGLAWLAGEEKEGFGCCCGGGCCCCCCWNCCWYCWGI